MKRLSTAEPRRPRVAIHTLGCPKNVVDSESLAVVLRSAGCELVSPAYRADVLVVNTCGFVDDAKVEAIEVLLEAVRWKQARRGRRVFAMGCLTQRDGAEIAAEIPELDAVFGIGEWTRMVSTLGESPLQVPMADWTVPVVSGAAGAGSAYLRVADGCSHACAFCSIPQMRGLYRSEPLESLVAEASRLARDGVREIILIGQETTSFGVDLYRERKIVELCQRLADIDGIHWIRILYAHPPTTPPSVMEQLARIPKLAPYIDFPVEHASDRMLTRMNRRTSAARMKDAIAAFRAARADAAVRTTALVGFPGETDDDFGQLYEFMEELRFERAGVFVYSPQAGTAGAVMPDRVEEGVALDRLDQLMRLQKRICQEVHQTRVGRTIDVLIERHGRDVSWGRSGWDAPDIDGRVRVNGKWPLGTILPVRVTRARAYQLDGESARDGDEYGRRALCGILSLPVLSSR